jgi:hypothetical protein
METVFSVVALVLSVVSVTIAVLSFLRAGRVERRSSQALVKAYVVAHPDFEESASGLTRLRLLNTGPAVAMAVRVVIHESEEDARAWGHSGSQHETPVVDRLGANDSKTIKALGLTDDYSKVWVHWSDSAGDHVTNPEPPPARQRAQQY